MPLFIKGRRLLPKWGLTDAQLAARPWGLDRKWLLPDKTVTDPVHGDVFLTVLERMVVDSAAMQRLRRVRQLGTTYLVYPGATHTRFSHSLGTMRAAQDLLDAVAANRTGPRAARDLLDLWDEEENGGQDTWAETGKSKDSVLDVRFAEATVLARLGALLHDACHIPLGHTIEDDLGVLVAHDKNEPRFTRAWETLGDPVRRVLDPARSRFADAKYGLADELKMLILSKVKPVATEVSSYPFVADIVGNTICADLIDYLRRDHVFTGLPLAVGQRFLNEFYVKPEHKHFAKRMVIRITRHGHARVDIVTELVKYLRYRYELTERVLTHHAKSAADAMIGKLLEMWHDSTWVDLAVSRHPTVVASAGRDDVDLLKHQVFAADPRAPQRTPGEDEPDVDAPIAKRSGAVADLEAEARGVLEDEFMRRSDDGLLEHLHALGEGPLADDRLKALGALAGAVLNRELYKPIGRAEGRADMALAREKYEKYGGVDSRRQLETDAAHLAEVQGWKVLIWLPGPGMRLKVAEVLVDDDGAIAPLDRISPAGKEIVEQHRHLWAISVFAEASIREEEDCKKVDVLLASLKTDMDIGLLRWDGQPVVTLQELAVNHIAKREHLDDDQKAQLLELVPAASRSLPGFRAYVDQCWHVAETQGYVAGPPPDNLW